MFQIAGIASLAAYRFLGAWCRAGRRFGLLFVVSLATAALVAASPARGQVSLTGLGLGGATYAYATGLSADGSTVSGNWTGFLDGIYTYRAFRWTAAAGMQLLGVVPGGDSSAGYGISGDGSTVVGYCWIPLGPISGSFRAARWTTSSGTQDLGSDGIAYAASSDGCSIAGFFDAGSNIRSFLWTPNGLGPSGAPWYTTPTGKGISADGTVVVGDGFPVAQWEGGQQRAFRWTASDGMQDLGTLGTGPGATSAATAVSADGSTIVGNWAGDNGSGAFRWTGTSGMQDLGTIPGGKGAAAYAVNGDGSMVVGLVLHPVSGYGVRSFLWTDSLGMLDLNDYLTSLGANTSAVPVGEAHGISADGSVITGSDYYTSWIVTGLPVPAIVVIWDDVGPGLAGAWGMPTLAGTGAQLAGYTCAVNLSNARPSSPAVLFVGLSSTPKAFKGGFLLPDPPLLSLAFSTSVDGTLPLSFAWPAGLPSGFSIYYQYAVKDDTAVHGVALSNALKSTTP